MKFSITNLVADSATTITASSENANFPASNLKNPLRSKSYRSTNNQPDIVFDLKTTQNIQCVALFWPKETGILLSSSATIYLQANATNVWNSPAVQVALTIDNEYMCATHFFSTAQQYRYWRISVVQTTGPGYFELGLVWLGEVFSSEQVQNGFKFTKRDLTQRTRTEFGHVYSDLYPTLNEVAFDFSTMTYEESQVLERAFDINGSHTPVLAAFDSDGTAFDKDHFLIYGLMDDTFELGHLSHKLFGFGMRITELA